jgi:hypothetical protein
MLQELDANDPKQSRFGATCTVNSPMGKSNRGSFLAAERSSIRATGWFLNSQDSTGSHHPAAWVVTRKTKARVRVSPQVGMEHPGRSCLTVPPQPEHPLRMQPSYALSHPDARHRRNTSRKISVYQRRDRVRLPHSLNFLNKIYITQIKATRAPARRMVATGAASTWAAPRQLLGAARSIARRMAAASAARSRAAPRQSLELQAACSARCVCGPHSRSPTMHKP